MTTFANSAWLQFWFYAGLILCGLAVIIVAVAYRWEKAFDAKRQQQENNS